MKAPKHRHRYRPVRGARTPSTLLPGEMLPQKCIDCASRFPCTHACDHVDCRIERGDKMPSWVTLVEPT